jgi:hypothetical protein
MDIAVPRSLLRLVDPSGAGRMSEATARGKVLLFMGNGFRGCME